VTNPIFLYSHDLKSVDDGSLSAFTNVSNNGLIGWEILPITDLVVDKNTICFLFSMSLVDHNISLSTAIANDYELSRMVLS